MKISVTKVRKTRSTYIDLTDEALSATIDIVTVTEHKLNFLVEMSDGRSYESTTTVAGTDSYSDCMGIDSPINDITKFSKDIEGVVFPDLVFYDDYDEYDEAESKNDESAVAVWLMYPNDRQVVGDMQLIEEKMTEFCTLNGKWRSTKERVYRIEIKMEMSNGDTYISSVNTSKFTYKPAGPATGRFPIDDLAKFHEALGKLVIQDLDVKKHGDILDEAAKQFVHYYGASRNPNYPGRETIRSVANRLNQIGN